MGVAVNFFWTGFEKRSAEAMKRVATVALLDVKNRTILMGRRRDNDKWTPPGGHLESGEDPIEGACREVNEEVGIDIWPDDLIKVKTETVTGPDGVKRKIYAYKAHFVGAPEVNTSKDPDDEFVETRWVQMRGGLPDVIAKNLHVPMPRNILLKNIHFPRKKRA